MKHLLLLSTLGLLAIACKKEKKPTPPEQAVNKTIEYHLFAGKDYSHPIYAAVTAQIRLQVRKINYHTGDMQLVWDSTIAERKITEFPQQAQRIILQKSFPVLESTEKLTGSFGVMYFDGGYISQFGASTEVVPGKTKELLEVPL